MRPAFVLVWGLTSGSSCALHDGGEFSLQHYAAVQMQLARAAGTEGGAANLVFSLDFSCRLHFLSIRDPARTFVSLVYV
eukprot:GDKH01023899.1.p2 GENE.GDKH01023899.1~~GDKH01023899.1.p2  ORF type:complete len:79 (-),score=3.84 GDKH01023899.1:55-291(-)